MADQNKTNEQTRALGRSGIEIAPIVFGGNVLGWTADKPRSFELLDHFVARGFNTIDTADVYSAWAPVIPEVNQKRCWGNGWRGVAGVMTLCS